MRAYEARRQRVYSAYSTDHAITLAHSYQTPHHSSDSLLQNALDVHHALLNQAQLLRLREREHAAPLSVVSWIGMPLLQQASQMGWTHTGG
jgi:hypothetical protein